MDSLTALINQCIEKAQSKFPFLSSTIGQVVSVENDDKYKVKILSTGSTYELPNYSGSNISEGETVYIYWQGAYLSNQSAYIGAAPTTITESGDTIVYVPSVKTYGNLSSEYTTIATIALQSFADTYTTLNFNAIIDCEESNDVSLVVIVDGATVSYAPKLTTVIGHNHISFALPIHLEETGEHIIYVKAKGSGSINHAESFLTGANIEEREIDTHGFQLNVGNFNPNEPYLYDVNGNVIGVVTMGSGTIAENVYTTEDGLHVTGLTYGNINVDLPLDEEWTIEYNIKDYVFDSNPTNTVNWIFNSENAGLETAAVKDFNSHAIHCRLNSSVNPTLYNYCTLSGSGNGFYDFATEPSMLYGFEMHYKWVNDGLNLTLWVNGMKKATLSSQYFTQENINKIGIPNSGNTAGNNRNGLVVAKLKVSDIANTTNDRVLYKWHITKFKAYEDWFTIKRLKLYTANNELIDQNENNYVCIFTNNGASQDGVQNSESLAYSLLAKAQSDGIYHDHGYIYRPNHTVDGDVIDVIYSVPSSLDAVASYSYVAPFDGGNIFDFTSWANVVKTYSKTGSEAGTNGIRRGDGTWFDNGFTMTKNNVSGWMCTLSTIVIGDASKVPTISLPYYMSQNKPYVLRFHVTSNVTNPRITVGIKAGNTDTTISDTEPTIDANGNVYVSFNTTERSISVTFGANDFTQGDYATISDIVLTDETFSQRQPVSWTFQKSTDGGVTWTTLDTQTDVPVPSRGLETAKFAVT